MGDISGGKMEIIEKFFLALWSVVEVLLAFGASMGIPWCVVGHTWVRYSYEQNAFLKTIYDADGEQ